ncbi:MAG: NYN domain-containing protein [Candidatus Yonathbacteria bacterium]|nr:NYN domain-containing protein [Candidatus Yonathbacteria bacterium]NTW47595.1 NYN domain-containing protein [Candidatus Yonathbacteria bacterium]
MTSLRKYNIAFIDGQNLHLGTTRNGWKVDFKKFRVYLRDKYAVQEAYYFIGYVSEKEQDLYNNLQKAGFIVIFKEHNSLLLAKKKGNVDTDIVFEIMKQVAENKELSKILLVSGDGDYKKVVDYLVRRNLFEKILFPNKEFASSLYKKLGSEYFDYLENNDVRKKIEFL